MMGILLSKVKDLLPSSIESIISGFYIYRGYLIILAIILFLVLYSVIVNLWSYLTEELFSDMFMNMNCCDREIVNDVPDESYSISGIQLIFGVGYSF